MTNDPWPTTDFSTTRPAVVDDLMLSPLLDSVVMMVDDDPLMVELVQGHLEDAGYRRFVACSEPLRTLSLLRDRRPALLLLDLMMPDVSGFELLSQIRRDDELRYLPVIVLTAATGADAKLRALQMGATDFLAKPVDASELVLRVRNTLAFRQYHERSLNYDEGSGLPSRRLFVQRLRTALEAASSHRSYWAVMNIRVPECNQLAEALGGQAGDVAAYALGTRMGQTIVRLLPNDEQTPGSGTVARLSVDEFVVLLGSARQLDQIETVAKDLLSDVSRPLLVDGHQLIAKPVAGIALVGSDGQSAETLLERAAQARSQAMRSAGEGFEFFSPELNRRALERMQQAASLRRAIAQQEFVVHYQPKVDLHSGVLAGAEALVRWRLPDGRLLPPMRFIPLAEELQLIGALGDWVLHQVCRDGVRWLRDGVPVRTLSVNVSQAQFTDGQIIGSVEKALMATGLPPEHLMLEITESMLMTDMQRATDTLHRLRELGVAVAIDDFGTGFSSLSYLKVFPVSELKIDRSFIVDLPGRDKDQAIVSAIVALGHHLGMTVVAEGVETPEQLLSIDSLGCDLYQGFLYSRPVPGEELVRALRQAA